MSTQTDVENALWLARKLDALESDFAALQAEFKLKQQANQRLYQELLQARGDVVQAEERGYRAGFIRASLFPPRDEWIDENFRKYLLARGI